MTEDAQIASGRYELLVTAWRALYSEALSRNDFGSPRLLSQTMDRAYKLAASYLESEEAVIEARHENIASEARRATLADLSVRSSSEASDALSEHLIDAGDYLIRELTIQIERDIAYLRNALRNTALHVAMAARSQRVHPALALMQYRMARVGDVQFQFQDRLNKRWPSAKFARAIWRHSLLNTYNETVMLTLAEHGVETAVVRHVNPNAASNGMIVALHAGSSYPLYETIRQALFHPNADAVLTGAP